MTDPTRTPLGASTLIRDWCLDVNTGTADTPVWTPVCGVSSLQPSLSPTMQDDSDFDSQGYTSQTVTALSWGVSLTLQRKATADGNAYDPGQEALRTASTQMGAGGVVGIRFYTMGDVRVEAYSGLAAVTWSPNGGDETALDSVAATLTGRGVRTAITHPYPATPAS